MPNIYPWWGGSHQSGQCPLECSSDEPPKCLTLHLQQPCLALTGLACRGDLLGWGLYPEIHLLP